MQKRDVRLATTINTRKSFVFPKYTTSNRNNFEKNGVKKYEICVFRTLDSCDWGGKTQIENLFH